MNTYTTSAATTRGMAHFRIGTSNEDRSFPDPESMKWFGVFDGVSEGGGGDIAASVARDTLGKMSCESCRTDAEIYATGKAILEAAHEAILKRQKEVPGFKGASTAVIAYIGEGRIHWFSVGDSAVFRITSKGKPIKLTSEDSVAGNMVAKGEISASAAAKLPSTQHALTRYLGMDTRGEDFRDLIHCGTEAIGPADSILLCSDGLYTHVPAKEIAKVVNNSPHPSEDLVTLAKEEYGSADDITCIVLKPLGQEGKKRGLPRALMLALAAIVFATGFFFGVFVKERAPYLRLSGCEPAVHTDSCARDTSDTLTIKQDHTDETDN